jgi:hypothetical protein
MLLGNIVVKGRSLLLRRKQFLRARVFKLVLIQYITKERLALPLTTQEAINFRLGC